MKYNGKKFSEIILEQGSEDYLNVGDIIKSRTDNLKQAEFMGKPVGGKFLGYNDKGEPEYELPIVTVSGNKPSGTVKFRLNIDTSSNVTNLKKV
jgi:hypothetical protein